MEMKNKVSDAKLFDMVKYYTKVMKKFFDLLRNNNKRHSDD